MAALRPDYDDDPDRWSSWEAPQDVHELVAPELEGPVLDVGCGDGRLAALAAEHGIAWTGVDSSPSQLSANPHRPVVLADTRQLPFRDGSFHEVTHLLPFLWVVSRRFGMGSLCGLLGERVPVREMKVVRVAYRVSRCALEHLLQDLRGPGSARADGEHGHWVVWW